MKLFKTIISSLKNTKLLIFIFLVLSIILNYLTTYIPVVIQYFIDIIWKQNWLYSYNMRNANYYSANNNNIYILKKYFKNKNNTRISRRTKIKVI